MPNRVVITAMGMVSSIGNCFEQVAHNINTERTTFRYFDQPPRVVVAPVDGFDVRFYTGRFKNGRYLHRAAAMTVAAAIAAVQQIDQADLKLDNAGLFVGTGPNLDLGGECPNIHQGLLKSSELPALWILRFLPNTAASVIAQLVGIHGENLTVTNACAASLQALGEGYRKIRHGYLKVAVAGGGDSRLSSGGLLAYHKANALSRDSQIPQMACRPFDQARNGFVPGEGGAFVVMESAESAIARKASIMAEICGYGASIDGDAMTAPKPDGYWAEQAVRNALAEAELQPEDIHMISAHGTGTPLNDAVEAQMIQRIFGTQPPMILALKSWIGHLAAACGVVELGVCLAAWQTDVWPYIRNLNHPTDSGLSYLQKGMKGSVGPLLLQNFGFGGQNAALVVRPWQP